MIESIKKVEKIINLPEKAVDKKFYRWYLKL